jgi:hypothetical protein
MIILPTANQVFFRAITPGTPNSGAKLDVAYVEFSNGTQVPPADVPPHTLRTYFDALASSAGQDYLRIPILSHSLGQTSDGRMQLTLVVATDGTAGVHGKPFSSAVGSLVYAITFAASQMNDRDDIFVARHHYIEPEQLAKPDNGAVMLTAALL